MSSKPFEIEATARVEATGSNRLRVYATSGLPYTFTVDVIEHNAPECELHADFLQRSMPMTNGPGTYADGVWTAPVVCGGYSSILVPQSTYFGVILDGPLDSTREYRVKLIGTSEGRSE